MKKFIFGLVLFIVGMRGVLGLWDHSVGQAPLFALMVFMAIAGVCLAFWEAFIAGRLRRWRRARVTIDILVNDKKIAALDCQRCDKASGLVKRATALEEVQQALGGKEIAARFYARGQQLELWTNRK